MMIAAQSPRFENVMIIDDNLIDLYIVSLLITKTNFGKKVLQYSSAIKAFNYLQENQEHIHLLPEIIFLDIYMPGMTGFEFMIEYERLPSTFKSKCKVFLLSSSIDARDAATAKNDKNIVAMKEKPITREFLSELKVSCNSPLF